MRECKKMSTMRVYTAHALDYRNKLNIPTTFDKK